MSRIYAAVEDGKRFLFALECDDCGSRIKPAPDIAKSGWEIRGWDNGLGTDKIELIYCPECVSQHPAASHQQKSEGTEP